MDEVPKIQYACYSITVLLMVIVGAVERGGMRTMDLRRGLEGAVWVGKGGGFLKQGGRSMFCWA